MAERVKTDTHLLKLMKKALETRQVLRAFDYCSLLYLPKSLALAVRLADREGQTELVQRLAVLLKERSDQFKQRELEESENRNQTQMKPRLVVVLFILLPHCAFLLFS